MPSLDLTPYNQAQGTTSDGSKFDNMLAAIQAVINALDNGNISPAAAIAYTKLALAGKINLASDVDVATSLAIARLAGYPADSSKALFGDGTWQTVGASNVGTQLDYKQIVADVAGITATTEGTAAAVVTGNSVVYDGTKVRVEFFCPQVTGSTSMLVTLVLLRDSTVVGQAALFIGASTPGTVGAKTIPTFDTPAAGAHTYSAKAFVSTGTGTVNAGAGGAGNLLPAYLRVTKA